MSMLDNPIKCRYPLKVGRNHKNKVETNKGIMHMENGEDKLYFGGHLVAFVDILGQSAKLSKLKKIKWWESDQETVPALQDTYGRVLKFRKIFNGFLSKFCKPSVLDNVFQEILDPDQMKVWNQFGQSRILTKGISDSLIMTLPLFLTNGLAPLKSIYGVLGACASSMLVSLNCQFAFRGAVEIGPCIFDTRSNEVYGSALNDAVRYEKDADWPRIIVGPALVNYLEECTKLPNKSPAYKINAALARRCLSVISKDESDIFFVDYLGKEFEFQALENTDKIIDGALKFVDSQIRKFEKDSKIGAKYIKLKKYFESRI